MESAKVSPRCTMAVRGEVPAEVAKEEAIVARKADAVMAERRTADDVADRLRDGNL